VAVRHAFGESGIRAGPVFWVVSSIGLFWTAAVPSKITPKILLFFKTSVGYTLTQLCYNQKVRESSSPPCLFRGHF
jgi:hypothetical protein